MRFLYIHGFASGPQSRKAQAFRKSLHQRGVQLEIPDLSENDFEHLTIHGQLAVMERTLQGQPARLIGSSLGGYLGALYCSAHPEVDRLVLLAPAFGFASRWPELAGLPAIERWRTSGWLDVFHYGDRAMRRVHYGLLEDALRYPAEPGAQCPVRIFHGVHDSVVSIEVSRRWAAQNPSVQLTEYDSDHELLNALDAITTASVPFLTG